MEETLVEKVIELTGLPRDLVHQEIKKWALEKGQSPQGMGLEELREVLVYFLQEVFCEVKAGSHKVIKISD